MGISINREVDLQEMIDEVRKRKLAGMPQLGKASMVDPVFQKSRDATMKRVYSHLFFDSRRHIELVTAYKNENPEYHPRLKASMSCPNVSIIAGACAGTSTYIDT